MYYIALLEAYKEAEKENSYYFTNYKEALWILIMEESRQNY